MALSSVSSAEDELERKNKNCKATIKNDFWRQLVLYRGWPRPEQQYQGESADNQLFSLTRWLLR